MTTEHTEEIVATATAGDEVASRRPQNATGESCVSI
jgi:hypothetical protein